MTHSPKDKKLSSQEIESIELAVEQVDIRAIHPDKMEAFADHLVQKLQNEKNSGPTVYPCNCTCASGQSICSTGGKQVRNTSSSQSMENQS